jgi:hypothetical protein
MICVPSCTRWTSSDLNEHARRSQRTRRPELAPRPTGRPRATAWEIHSVTSMTVRAETIANPPHITNVMTRRLAAVWPVMLTTVAGAAAVQSTDSSRVFRAEPHQNGRPPRLQPGSVNDTDYVLPYQSNFTGREAFTAPRGKDGRCNWSVVRPKRRLVPNAENAFIGEKHERTCDGVFYFTFIPPEYRVGGPGQKPEPGVKSDTTTVVASDEQRMPTPEGLRAARAAVLKRFTKPETISISNSRVKGDSAWLTVRHAAASTTYTVVKRGAAWEVVRHVTHAP